MKMIDSGESDYKIIAVPTEDKRWEDVKDIGDINQHTLKEIKHFFETYKLLKGKPAPVEIGATKGKKEAVETFNESIKLYQAKFAK
jgi:inorganic pyrophosphatase